VRFNMRVGAPEKLAAALIADHFDRILTHRAPPRKHRGDRPAILKERRGNFFCGGDSRINGNMIHAGDGDFGVAFVGP
jgi:hypothetical protein